MIFAYVIHKTEKEKYCWKLRYKNKIFYEQIKIKNT